MKNILRNTKGQLSIFFATNVIVIITFIGLVINIGMFVKAKINLQNATDAAAWAGAAVQARQLSNIAYLNWEMRNIYKEWMFKYYILGNLQVPPVEEGPSGSFVNYGMRKISTSPDSDPYNFPSICIEFGNTGGAKICRTYKVPGIPRFEGSTIASIDQATQAFVNAIEEQKNLDCARRSNINFLINNLWAYNVLTNTPETNSLQAAAPNLAANRLGAWPAAFEVAVRIRNLEHIMNKKPYTEGVCFSPGASRTGIACAQTINELSNSASPLVSNERVVKAFMSAYRNFGETADGANELKNTFTLTEISPTPVISENEQALSNLLIPPSASKEKYYVDLKLVLLNLATFYTSFFTPKDGEVQTSSGNVATNSGCDATKVALPVPGYPFGYTKNPDLVTYYAVKGEADFIGLFNPFDPGPIKLTAFAAAKPFGGRIGPLLFNTGKHNETVIKPRGAGGGGKSRTSAYISGLDLVNIVNSGGMTGDYVPGSPIPGSKSNFWVTELTDEIGGWVTASNIKFVIPNLVYDYVGGSPSNDVYNYPDQLQRITPLSGENPTAGLYNTDELSMFRSLLPNIGGNISPNDIEQGILQARGPTKYEAFNYLIPLPSSVHQQVNADSYGIPNRGDNNRFSLNVFAPLFGDTDDYIFKNSSDIVSVAHDYLQYQKPSIDAYRGAMNLVANAVAGVRGPDGSEVGMEAAKNISDINFGVSEAQLKEDKPSCNSMTGRFLAFYLGADAVSNYTGCPKGLKDQLEAYWSLQGDSINKDFYNIEYALKDGFGSNPSLFFSAYKASRIQGGNPNGIFINPFTGQTENMIRNFYSTKLISLRSVSNASENYYNQSASNFPTISEGNETGAGYVELNQDSFRNPILFQNTGIQLNSIDQ